MTQKFTREQLVQMIEACVASVHRLNDWEQNFIESMSERADNGGGFSDAMAEKIEQCYLKV